MSEQESIGGDQLRANARAKIRRDLLARTDLGSDLPEEDSRIGEVQVGQPGEQKPLTFCGAIDLTDRFFEGTDINWRSNLADSMVKKAMSQPRTLDQKPDFGSGE